MATRNIGLVLDGGGGKGAYQLGVWKALRDTGLDERIAQISGASVGGLNAALMVQGDYDLAERIWFEKIKTLKPTRIHMWVEGIIKEHLDFSAFSKSEITCWLATTCISPIIRNIECLEPNGRKLCKEKAHYFNMNVLNEVNCRKLLTENVLSRAVMLATCALPLICTSKRIDGLWYLDGGLVDNSPVTPIFDVPRYSDNIPKCDRIIIIHLDPVANDYDPGVWEGVTVLQITPNTDVGGFFTENDLILELQQEEVFHFHFRILRLVPQEQVVITEHGLVDKMSFTFRRNLDMENNVFDESVFSKIQPLSYQQPFDAIILPYGAYQKHASDITRINTKQRIDFNQYQMRLFMRNHSFLPRQQIVMIDIYDGKSYISGFVVGENNTYTTVFENEEASWYFGPMKRKAEKCFEKNGIEPQSTKFGISSSMIGESWNKWYKNMADIFLLDENQLWQDENAIQCLLNLSTADKM